MSQTENVLQTVKTMIQDIVAPDVRELKVRLAAFQEQVHGQFEAVHARFEAVQGQFDAVHRQFEAVQGQFDAMQGKFVSVQSQFEALHSQIAASAQQSEAQYKSLLSAIGQSKAESELSNFRAIAALSERVAALEASRQ